MVKRLNRTLEMQLSKFVDYNQKDWVLYIPLLLMVYWSAIQVVVPLQSWCWSKFTNRSGIWSTRRRTSQSITEYANSMQAKAKRVHNFAPEHINMMSDKMKQRDDLNFVKEGQSPPMLFGSIIHRKRMELTTTSPPRPLCNYQTYRVQLGPNSKPKATHRNRL